MNADRTTIGQVNWLVATLFVGLCVAGSDVATACSTPVYRYAMYRWYPAPYTVFYFHKEEEAGEADQALHAAIEAYGDYTKDVSANIDLVKMDLNQDPELKRLPPFLRKAWEEDNDGNLPAYMVISPLGEKMLRGSLALDEVKSLIESPARTEIMKFLREGKTCVYVMLTSSDAKKNAAAEEAAKKAIKAVESGEIEFYDGELPYWGGEEEDPDEEDAQQEKASTHSIGWLKLDRSSEPERWLVRSLLKVEYDLAELDEPMIFAVFGRGRALPPYVGKGVTYDNLLDYFAEVTGACSCTVKDQNPGMDLPMLNDWEAVAEAMAGRYGAEEGAEGSVGDLFPQLVVPGDEVAEGGESSSEPMETEEGGSGDAAPVESSPAEPGGTDPQTAGGAAESTPAAAIDDMPSVAADEQATATDLATQPTATTQPAGQEPRDSESNGPGDAAAPSPDVGQAEPMAVAKQPDSSGTQQLMLTMGIGLGITVVVLLLATMLLGRGGR